MKGRALSAGGGNLERGEILCLSSVSGVCASKVKIVLSVDVGRYTRACVCEYYVECIADRLEKVQQKFMMNERGCSRAVNYVRDSTCAKLLLGTAQRAETAGTIRGYSGVPLAECSISFLEFLPRPRGERRDSRTVCPSVVFIRPRNLAFRRDRSSPIEGNRSAIPEMKESLAKSDASD